MGLLFISKVPQYKIHGGGLKFVMAYKHLPATFPTTKYLPRLTGFAGIRCQSRTRAILCPACVLSMGT